LRVVLPGVARHPIDRRPVVVGIARIIRLVVVVRELQVLIAQPAQALRQRGMGVAKIRERLLGSLVSVQRPDRGVDRVRLLISRRHAHRGAPVTSVEEGQERMLPGDRKSTRLNSSHVAISYAVFCLKKKTTLSPLPSPPQLL